MKNVGKWLATIMLIGFTVFTVFPIYWMIITSIKKPLDTTKPTLIPFIDFTPTLRTWYDVLLGLKSYETRRALINSTITASVSSIISVLLGSMAGYGLSKFKFKRWKNRDIMSFVLAQRMLPPIVALIPLFIMMHWMKLVDNVLALILIHSAFNIPFVVWIMKDFFDELPVELEEAGLVDGLSHFQVFRYIVLPLSKPGLIVSWIFSFAFSWNEFITVLSLAYTKAITLTWLISTGHHARALEWWTISTYGTLSIIPPMMFAVIIQKYIIRGLTLGAVKG